MQQCPECHAIVDDEAVFCDQCGYRLKPAAALPEMTAYAAPPVQLSAELSSTAGGSRSSLVCKSCGYANLPGEAFCVNCGVQLNLIGETSLPERPSLAELQPDSDVFVESSEAISESTRTCPNCGFINSLKDIYCQDCGFGLTKEAGHQLPQSLQVDQPAGANLPDEQGFHPLTQPKASFLGRLFSPATNTSLFLPAQPEIVIGRRDPERAIFPDVDLSGEGSASNSISRRHALLRVDGSQVFVEDLNSTNASYLNRQRLQPGQRYPINDGDELRLGGVALIFYAQL